MPSSTAARVACIASSTRSLRSLTSTSVAPPTRITATPLREDRVQEGNVGVWMDSTTRWTDWLRATVGIHEDMFAGRVMSGTLENSGNAQASITSPKAGIVLGPWYKTEFFVNAGYG